jgi:hypothetical protein
MIKITEGVSHFLFNKLPSALARRDAMADYEQFLYSEQSHLIYQLTRRRRRLSELRVAYLNVHIAVGIESAVDHMQGDIDVRHRVQEVNDIRFLHLHDDDGFFTHFFLFFFFFLYRL